MKTKSFISTSAIIYKLFIGFSLLVSAPSWVCAEGYRLFSDPKFPELAYSRPDYQAYFNRPLTIENQGHYPIISLKVDGLEQIAPGYHLPAGSGFQVQVSLFYNHTVEATYGTSASNYYGLPFQPLFVMRIPSAQAGTTVTIGDWSASDALTGNPWHGQYLVNGLWVDSWFSFQSNGTFTWTLSYGGGAPISITGTFTGGAVNTYGIMREINVVTSGGERDTLVLLEYERILNVNITDGGFSGWVPHSQP